MLKRRTFLLLSILLTLSTLTGCSLAPAAPPIVGGAIATPTLHPLNRVSTPRPTATLSPTRVPNRSAALAPTPTLPPDVLPTDAPEWFSQMDGVESLLPSGVQVLRELAWPVRSDKLWFNLLAVPYQAPGAEGLGLAFIGLPRSPDDSWDGSTRKLVSDWPTTGTPPLSFSAVSSFNSQFFLGQLTTGDWRLVEISGDGGETPLAPLAVLPVEHSDDLSVQIIQMGSDRPAEYLLRDGQNLRLYRLDQDLRPAELWAADGLPGRSFNAIYQQDNDLTGDGQPELLVAWAEDSGADPSWVQVYQVETQGLTLLGGMPAGLQRVDLKAAGVQPDGGIAYLKPDPLDQPARWQVYHWSGKGFEADQWIDRPVGAKISLLAADGALPRLPIALFFQTADGWQRIEPAVGKPQALPVNVKPPEPLQCRDNEDFICNSPGDRFNLSNDGSSIEGVVARVFDKAHKQTVEIPERLQEAGVFNSLAWSPDGAYLLLAQAPFAAVLDKVNPSSGERTPLLALTGCDKMLGPCLPEIDSLGAIDPTMLRNSAVAFAIQNAGKSVYPPPGVYQWSAKKGLSLLVELPPLTLPDGRTIEPADYGQLLWSPDRTAFVYQSLVGPPSDGQAARQVVIGRLDLSSPTGWSAVDVTAQLDQAWDFRWKR